MDDLKEIMKAGVSDEEVVARAIFSPSFFTRAGKIGSQAYYFTPFRGRVEKDISVLRVGMCPNLEAAIKRIAPRNDRDKVSGYAEINVANIRKLSYTRNADEVLVDVIASPSRTMPFHAGVIIKNHGRKFSSDDMVVRPIQPALMSIMAKLARISTYIPFPEEGNETGDKLSPTETSCGR